MHHVDRRSGIGVDVQWRRGWGDSNNIGLFFELITGLLKALSVIHKAVV
jgi:hypothetical protein